jgi:hypothetical protein
MNADIERIKGWCRHISQLPPVAGPATAETEEETARADAEMRARYARMSFRQLVRTHIELAERARVLEIANLPLAWRREVLAYDDLCRRRPLFFLVAAEQRLAHARRASRRSKEARIAMVTASEMRRAETELLAIVARTSRRRTRGDARAARLLPSSQILVGWDGQYLPDREHQTECVS